jgi:hypothetical protein
MTGEVSPTVGIFTPQLFLPSTRAHPRENTMPSMPSSTLCPHCGLRLTLKTTPTGTRVTYNFQVWKRLCQHPSFENPVHCLVKRGSNDWDAHAATPSPMKQ